MSTREATPTIIERRWTTAEYLRLPEGPPYYELEDGKLIEMVRPRGKHQKIIGRLFAPALFSGLAFRMADLLRSTGAVEEIQE